MISNLSTIIILCVKYTGHIIQRFVRGKVPLFKDDVKLADPDMLSNVNKPMGTGPECMCSVSRGPTG